MADDYGQAAWAESLVAATEQAATWIQTVAEARGWDGTDAHGAAMGLLSDAWDAAEGADNEARAFWAELAERWDEATDDDSPAGWEKLGGVWHSAAGTAKTVEEGRELGSAASLIEGTIDGIANDVKEGGDWWGKHGKKVIGGLVILGVIIAVKRA
jgi:hypothetical protein